MVNFTIFKKFVMSSFSNDFSVLAGWLILHEGLSTRQLTGCGLIFAAIILAQLPAKKKQIASDAVKENN